MGIAFILISLPSRPVVPMVAEAATALLILLITLCCQDMYQITLNLQKSSCLQLT